MTEELVPIGQVAEWFQMRVSALRYYEDEGLLTTQRRNGRRHFTPADLRRLTLVRTYIEGAMLSLDDVRALVAAAPAARRLAEQRLTELRAHVDSTCAALRLLRHHIDHSEPDQLSCPECDRELRLRVSTLTRSHAC
ncbi:MerR family transcriptional regulator [Kutzneria kofuensis]|jgi:DNA-binding transcriptional MerR regulator|uniref:DNA-binding transcriptional MerR regulator n=1 Tax=Kutzneria kofuensis TaxID=103725 RepID=A0A7W9KSU1_9PSEU|nr:MerR family transcriptional regulator [Kutzneria kofuensis]MBB5897783.1 DNA-binding transcriptional MerR regulator [Kutzneria kofuensis]